MMDWQPIETAPLHDLILLAAPRWEAPGFVMSMGFWEATDHETPDGFWWAYIDFDMEPTHWMPMPGEPKMIEVAA